MRGKGGGLLPISFQWRETNKRRHARKAFKQTIDAPNATLATSASKLENGHKGD